MWNREERASKRSSLRERASPKPPATWEVGFETQALNPLGGVEGEYAAGSANRPQILGTAGVPLIGMAPHLDRLECLESPDDPRDYAQHPSISASLAALGCSWSGEEAPVTRPVFPEIVHRELPAMGGGCYT